MKTGIKILPLLFVLASCIGMDADINIAANGRVDCTLVYTVSQSIDQFGKIDGNALPLPISREDFALAANRSGGTVQNWRREEGKENFTIRTALSFPDPQSFARFMDPGLENAVYTEAGGIRTLRLVLSEGINPNRELADFLRMAFADYRIKLSFNLPANIRDGKNLGINGRNAIYENSAADLYSATEAQFIEISW